MESALSGEIDMTEFIKNDSRFRDTTKNDWDRLLRDLRELDNNITALHESVLDLTTRVETLESP